ncbi:DUF4214 domain-containing protein [[Empedobacter] haloabium]|uniref:DUF4214 domain-containing protein n=1 Tax=[Empedobacter] haloabium TaxID=592317 RepID=A0ABZ1UQM9_9BURK
MVAIVGGKGFGLATGSAGELGKNGIFGEAAFGTSKEGVYLNVVNGNLSLQDKDGFVAVEGVNLAYTRTYNSLGSFGKGPGNNWSNGLARLNGAPRLAQQPSSPLVPFTRTAGDGSVSTFTYDTARGAYVSTDGGGAYQTIRWSATDAKWHWTGGRDDDKELYESYNDAGLLVASGDEGGKKATTAAPFGTRITYEYDARERLISVNTSSVGTSYAYRTLSDGNTELLVTQNMFTGATFRASYITDPLGRLVRVVTDLTPAIIGDEPANARAPATSYAVTYGYVGNTNLINSIVQDDGSALNIAYEGDKVASITERDNSAMPVRTTSFNYRTDGDRSVTRVTDPLGLVTTYTADAQGRLVEVAGPDSATPPLRLKFAYETNGDVHSVTDAANRTTEFKYDTHGNCVQQRDTDGNTVTRTFRLVDAANPARGYTSDVLTETAYAGTASTQPLTTRYVYHAAADKAHLVRFAITAQGRVTEYGYDAAGQRVREWTFLSKAYDLSRLAATALPTEADVATWANPGSAGAISRTDYIYERGLLVSRIAYASAPATDSASGASGAQTSRYKYDYAGNLLSSTENGIETSFTYDGLGRVLTKRTADGLTSGVTTYVYAGNAIGATITTPDGITTVKVYDSAGRLLTTQQSITASDGKLVEMLVTRNTYDAAGRLRMTTAPGGSKTVWLYDTAGRKVAEVGPDGALTEHIYTGDASLPTCIVRYGNLADLTTLFDGGQLRLGVTLDQLRTGPLAVTSDFDRKSWQRYDSQDRLVASADPEGYITRNTYDGAGRLVLTVRRAARLEPWQLAGGITWDATGDPQSADDRVTRMVYDADGLLTGKVETRGSLSTLTEYVYNGAGKLIETIAYGMPVMIPATLTAVAQLRPADTSAAIRERMLYDGHGRLRATLDGDNYLTEVIYNQDGRVARRIRYAAQWVSNTLPVLRNDTAEIEWPTANDRVTTYTYTMLGQVKDETVTDGKGAGAGGYEQTTYTYDKFGNVLSVVRTSGLTASRTYDAMGRLVSERAAANLAPTTYTYNAAGQRASMTDGNGNKTLYFYDPAGRLVYTIDAMRQATQQIYDAFGQVIAVRRYLSPAQAIAENATLEQVRAALQLSNGDLVSQFRYDNDGRLRYAIDAAGGVSETTYDAFGQAATLRYTSKAGIDMTAAVGKVPGAVVGTPLAALTQLSGAVGQRVKDVYTSTGRVTYTTDTSGAVESRTYDAYGRMTEKRLHANRAGSSGSTTPDSVESYAYDKRGNVILYKDAQGASTASTYSAFGELLTRTTGDVALAGTTLVTATTAYNVYNDDGRLVGTLDPAGTLTTFTYDNDGNVTRRLRYATTVTTAVTLANVYTVAWAAQGKDEDVRYFYQSGRLYATAKADVNGWSVETVDYDAAGNVQSRRAFATRMNKTPTVDTIQAWAGTAASASDAVQYTFYDAAGRPDVTAALQGNGADGIPNWSVTRTTYDAAGRVLERRALAQPLSAKALSGALLRAAPVGDSDAVTRYQYDGAGRVIATAVAQGKPAGGAMRWAVSGNVYDGAGNLVRTTQYATALEGTPPGDLLGTVRADKDNDRVTRGIFDAGNRLVATIDATGMVTGFVYDAKGNRVETRVYAAAANADGTLPLAGPLDRVSRTAYDLNGRARFEIDAAGAVTERRYDALGNVVQLVRYETPLSAFPAAAGADAVAKLVKAAAGDRSERYIYDQNGRLRFSVDAAGYFVEQRYDALGNRIATVSYPTELTPAERTGSESALVTALLASAGRQNAATTVLRPRTVGYTYDTLGRVLSTTDALQKAESYTYDAIGRRLTLKNKLNQIWTYTYDAAGRLLQEETPTVDSYSAAGLENIAQGPFMSPIPVSQLTRYAYDALGNLKTRSEGIRQHITETMLRSTRYEYDLAGRQVKTLLPPATVYDPAKDGPSSRAVRNETTLADLYVEVSYDTLGNAVRNRDVAGNVSYKSYDLAGRVSNEIDALGYVTHHKRNSFGEVAALTRYADAIPGIESYDPAQRAKVLKQREAAPANRVVRTEYDLLGRAVKVTEPASSLYDTHSLSGEPQLTAARTTVTRYNGFGEVAERNVYGADASGKALTQAASTLYYYDQRGDKRAQVDVLDATAPKGYLTTWKYDDAGRLTETQEFATAIGKWDAAQSLWTATSPQPPASASADRTTVYTYDANGNKLSELRKGAEVNAATTYAYDELGRLYSTTDASNTRDLIWYDALGRTVRTARVANSSAKNPYTQFRLDVFGNTVLRIEYADGTSALTPNPALDRITATVYDTLGRAVKTIDAENKTINYSYDRFGRVAKQWRSVTSAGTQETAFTINAYDALGRLVDVTQPGNVDLLANGAGTPATPPDTIRHTDYNAFGEAIANTVSSAGKVLRREETRYDNAGNAWLSNAGDGVYKVTLFDVQGNATSSIVSETIGALAGLTDASQALGRMDVRRTDTRYDMLGHVADSAVWNPLLTVLVREDGNWVRKPQQPGQVSDNSQLLIGDINDWGSVVTVRYRAKGTQEWTTAAPQRVHWLGDSLAFSTIGLDAGDLQYEVWVQAPGDTAARREAGTLTVKVTEREKLDRELVALYTMLFNRAPDANGLNFWLDAYNEGRDTAQLLSAMLLSEEAASRGYNADDPVKTITTIYQQAFGVAATDTRYKTEIAEWAGLYARAKSDRNDGRGQVLLDLLDAIRGAGGDLAKVIAAKTEALYGYMVKERGTNQFLADQLMQQAVTDLPGALKAGAEAAAAERNRTRIVQLYVALFGRVPEAKGVNDQLAKLAGAAMTDVVAGFLASAEAQAPWMYPSDKLSTDAYNQQLVTRLHHVMLGRPPTPTEQGKWMAKFAATPAITPAQFVLDLIDNVTGYRGQDKAPLAERNLFNNKVALAYESAVTKGNQIDGATGRAMLAGVTTAGDPQAALKAAQLGIKAALEAATLYEKTTSVAASGAPYEEMQRRVAQLYVVLLGRAPDKAGFNNYMTQLPATDADWTRIATGFLAVDELHPALRGWGTMSNDTFVRQLYVAALGTCPAAAEKEVLGYVDMLAKGMPRTELAWRVATGMLDSPGLPADQSGLRATFGNKVAVAMLMGTQLDIGNATVLRDVLNQVTATDIASAIRMLGDAALREMQAGAQRVQAAAAQGAQLAQAGANGGTAGANRDTALAKVEATPSARVRMQLMQMYVGLLGRSAATFRLSPDLDAINDYATRIGNASLEQTAQHFIESPEGQAIYAGLAPADFVRRVYSTVLGRPVSGIADVVPQATLDAWTAALGGTAPKTRGTVALGILNEVIGYQNGAPDARTVTFLSDRSGFSARVYDAYIEVDKAITTKVSELSAKAAPLSVRANELKTSLEALTQEYNAIQLQRQTDSAAASAALGRADKAGDGLGTLRLRVVQLYASLLQRPIAPQLFKEVDYHAQPDTALKTIAYAMLNGPDGSKMYSGLSDEAFVRTLYQNILGRTEVTPAEVDMYATQLRSGAGDPYARAQLAVTLLTAFLSYSEGHPAGVAYKERFDSKVAGFLLTMKAEAEAAANKASDDYGRVLPLYRDYETAKSKETAALKAKAAAVTWGDYGRDLLKLPTRHTVVDIYAALRGDADYKGVVDQMRNIHAGRSTDQLMADLIAVDYPADDEAFVRRLYLKVLNKANPTRAEVDWHLTNELRAKPPVSRVTVAKGFMNDASHPYAATTTLLEKQFIARAETDINAEQPAIDAAAEATRAVAAPLAKYNGAGITIEQATAKKLATSNELESLKELISANDAVIKADGAIKLAAETSIRYNAANSDWSKAQADYEVYGKPLAAMNAAAAPSRVISDALLAVASEARTAIGVATTRISTTRGAMYTQQIVQLYIVLLNRPPLLGELHYWHHRLLDRSANTSQLAATLMATPEAQRNALYPAGMSDAQFVTQLYNFGLGRDFKDDPTGLAFWTRQLSATVSRADLAVRFVAGVTTGVNADATNLNNRVAARLGVLAQGSESAADLAAYTTLVNISQRSIAAQYDSTGARALAADPAAGNAVRVVQLYTLLYNRVPEPSGVRFWLDALKQSNGDLVALARSMLGQAEEGKLLYPDALDNDSFLAKLFKDGLGHVPGAAETLKYRQQLASQSRAQVVLNLIADLAADGDDLLARATSVRFQSRVGAGLQSLAQDAQRDASALRVADEKVRAMDWKAIQPHTLAALPPVIGSSVSGIRTSGGTRDKYTVDRWGNILTVADARNSSWLTTMTYDGNNRVLTSTLPMTTQVKAGTTTLVSLQTTNKYDALGRLQSSTEGGSGVTRVTGYEYNAQGIVTRETHADGGSVSYTIDAFGQRIASTEMLDGTEKVVYNYDYDRLGRLVRRTSAVTEIANWQGIATGSATNDTKISARIVDTYGYDELGRRIAVGNGTLADTEGAQPVMSQVRRYRYDLGGNVIASYDGAPILAFYDAEMATYRVYDALNQKVAERENSTAGLETDLAKSQSWQYDGFGRVTLHVDLGGNRTSSTYNGAGQLASTDTVTVETDLQPAAYQRVTYSYETGTGLLLETKDIDYRDAAMTVALDNPSLSQLARYGYDRAGNRVSEQTWLLDAQGRRVRAVQANTLTYDARNRLTGIDSDVRRARYKVRYELDAFGNRGTVSTSYVNDVGDAKSITVDYAYDKMNRVVKVGGQVVTTYRDPKLVQQPAGPRRDDYAMPRDDVPSYWKEFDNKTITSHDIKYDFAGNRIEDKYLNGTLTTETYRYDALGRLSQILTNGTESGYRRYDSAGRVIASRDNAERQLNDYDAHGNLAYQRTLDGTGNNQRSMVSFNYDHGGNLSSYKAYSGNATQGQTTTNTYGTLRGSRLLTRTDVTNDGGPTKTSQMEYDANGFMIRVTGENARELINDRDGHVLEKTQNNVQTHTLIANGEMIGTSSAAHESFSNVHQVLSAASPNDSNTGVYVVQSDNEKLTSIAKNVWGDERLWYLIADANGLTAIDTPLKAGQQLVLPAKATTIYNGADTFRPYNASEVIGSTTPEMALPPPQAAKKGCGVIGQILTVIVAVVVTHYLGAIPGSIASQLTAMATGSQDKFDWKAVGRAAISAAVTQGMSELQGMPELFKGDTWQAAAARAAASNVVSQTVAVATGLQEKFEWRNVAASAAGAGVGQVTSQYLSGSNPVAAFLKGSPVTRATAIGFAAGVATAVARGGKIEIVQIAADAFGNALGNSLAGMGSQSGDAQQASRATKPISREQAERNMYGGLTSRQFLGGAKDWLSALETYDDPYGKSGNDERLSNYQAPIPQVVVDGGDVNQRLNAIFGLTPKNIGPVQMQSTQIDFLAAAAASDRRFYTSREAGASNGYSAAAWHIGGLLNEVGYDLAKTAQGAFQLVTDSNTRAAAYNALKFAANNPGVIVNDAIQGFKDFSNKPFAEQADSVFKFGAGGLATVGVGKVGMLAVDGAITGATATVRWLAPKAGSLLENYMYRTGGLAYAVEPGNEVGKNTIAAFSPIVTDGGLAAHEAAGGHLLLKHVAQTEAQLLNRLAAEPKITGSSSFYNRATAEVAISDALDVNQARINAWLGTSKPQMILEHTFMDNAGLTIQRGMTNAVDTSSLRLILRQDTSMPSGFRIHTGFPIQ